MMATSSVVFRNAPLAVVSECCQVPMHPFGYDSSNLFLLMCDPHHSFLATATVEYVQSSWAEAQVAVKQVIAMETQRKTILIVDDDEQVLIDLERLLEDQGYDTTTVWSGGEALQLLQSKSFDFVLLDGDLPDLTREELMRQAQKCSKSHWIVLQPQTRFRPEPVPANAVCKSEHGAILSKLRECLSGREHVVAGKRAGNIA